MVKISEMDRKMLDLLWNTLPAKIIAEEKIANAYSFQTVTSKCQLFLVYELCIIFLDKEASKEIKKYRP